MIEGVTVIGDLLRPDGGGAPGGVDRATVWLFDAIKRQVHLASRLPVDVVTATGLPALRDWLGTLRGPSSAHRRWASWYQDVPWSEELERILIPRLRHRFCVGYEMPPWLRHLLTALDTPHIDIRVHPVRFLDDLLFAVGSSHAQVRQALLEAAIPESLVMATAGLREAMCHMISAATLPAGTLIAAGQRPLDASQIVDGRFFDPMGARDEIMRLCARYSAVALKPHPLEPEHGLMTVAAWAPNVAGVVRDNLYRLMSFPEITGILTVNSSVAYEAPYFGKRVHTLAPLPIRLGWRGTPDEDGVYASLDDWVLTADFWRLVLSPHTAVSAPDGARLPPKPNRLRIALDSFWNFQEIDTDRIPARA